MSHATRRAPRRAALALLTLLAAAPAARCAPPPYPPSRVEVARDTLHGVVVEDPYRWLEDQDAPETRA
jgi:prolyl oligopeptidase